MTEKDVQKLILDLISNYARVDFLNLESIEDVPKYYKNIITLIASYASYNKQNMINMIISHMAIMKEMQVDQAQQRTANVLHVISKLVSQDVGSATLLLDALKTLRADATKHLVPKEIEIIDLLINDTVKEISSKTTPAQSKKVSIATNQNVYKKDEPQIVKQESPQNKNIKEIVAHNPENPKITKPNQSMQRDSVVSNNIVNQVEQKSENIVPKVINQSTQPIVIKEKIKQLKQALRKMQLLHYQATTQKIYAIHSRITNTKMDNPREYREYRASTIATNPKSTTKQKQSNDDNMIDSSSSREQHIKTILKAAPSKPSTTNTNANIDHAASRENVQNRKVVGKFTQKLLSSRSAKLATTKTPAHTQ